MNKIYLGIDPGRSKTGLAVTDNDGKILYLKVAETEHILAELHAVRDKYPVQQLVIGNGTNSKYITGAVTSVFADLPLEIVGEAHSTEEARKLYWELNPPQGFRKIIPLGLLVPEEPLDAYAAVVLIKRFLKQKRSG